MTEHRIIKSLDSRLDSQSIFFQFFFWKWFMVMTAYLLENNNLDLGQLLILVGVIWLKCELGLGVNLQLKHKDISGFTLWQKRMRNSVYSHFE